MSNAGTSTRVERVKLSTADTVAAMSKMIGLMQVELAARRGVSGRVIQDLERGTSNPTVEPLNSIGKLFGLQFGFVRQRRSELADGSSE